MITRSSDNTKLIVIATTFLASLLTVFNAVPVVILLAGAWLAHRDDDPDTIRVTTRLVQWLYTIVTGVSVATAVISGILYPHEPETVMVSAVIAAASIVMIFLLPPLWMKPMMRRISAVS